MSRKITEFITISTSREQVDIARKIAVSNDMSVSSLYRRAFERMYAEQIKLIRARSLTRDGTRPPMRGTATL